MAEVNEPEAGCSAVDGPHSLGARIRALKTLDPGKLDALGAEADALQLRHEAAEARAAQAMTAGAQAAGLVWTPAPWWVVQAPDGQTWRETDDEAEARAAVREGDTLLRKWVAEVPAELVPHEYRVIVDATPPADGEGRTFAHG